MTRLLYLAVVILSICTNISVQAVETPLSTIFLENFESKTLGSFVKSTSTDYSQMTIEIGPGKVSKDFEEDEEEKTATVNEETPFVTEASSLVNYGLILKQEARKYALTAPFPNGNYVIGHDETTSKPFVIQYEVRLQDGLTCGGAYVKLYEGINGFSAYGITSASPYVIMFGPDKCGTTDKVHFIIRWRNPINGETEEKHLTNPPRTKSDTLTHVYTIIIRPDDTFTLKIDNQIEREGSLRSDTDFSPAILPSPIIDDPKDTKPVDWVDEAQIPDSTATKPVDWDEEAPASIPDDDAAKPVGWLDNEPDYVPDPQAIKPEGWDEEEDGDWNAPEIPNPKCETAPGCGEWIRPMKKNPAYKGKWSPPLIANPDYKGEWKPKQIENPNYFVDSTLYKLGKKPISAIGIEIWTMNGNMLFDNFLVCTDEQEANNYAEQTWHVKYMKEYKAAQADARREARLARAAAAEGGGIMENLAFYMGELIEVAQDNPTATIATIVVTAITLSITCYMACATSDTTVDPTKFDFVPDDNNEDQINLRNKARDLQERARAREAAQKQQAEREAQQEKENDQYDNDENEEKEEEEEEEEKEAVPVIPVVSPSKAAPVPSINRTEVKESKVEEFPSPPVSQKKSTAIAKETPVKEEITTSTPAPVSEPKTKKKENEKTVVVSPPTVPTPTEKTKSTSSSSTPVSSSNKTSIPSSTVTEESNPVIKHTIASSTAAAAPIGTSETITTTPLATVAEPTSPAPVYDPSPIVTQASIASSTTVTDSITEQPTVSSEEPGEGSAEVVGASPEKKATNRRRANRKD